MKAAFFGVVLLMASLVAGSIAHAADAPDYFPKQAFFASEAEVQEFFSRHKVIASSPQDMKARIAAANQRMDGFKRRSYNAQLLAMEEPILFGDKSGPAVVRLTWLRSFHKPMSFRLSADIDGTSTIIVKQLDKPLRFTRTTNKPGPIVQVTGKLDLSKEVRLGPDKTKELLDGLRDLKVFSLPKSNFDFGLDGSRWVLEVSENGKYHVLDRRPGGEIKSQLLPLPLHVLDHRMGGDIKSWSLSLMRASGVELGEVY